MTLAKEMKGYKQVIVARIVGREEGGGGNGGQRENALLVKVGVSAIEIR